MTATITQKQADQIQQAIPFCLTETNFAIGKKYRGKVRDSYDLNDELLLITTDRQSAFDRVLAAVPYKGQILNLISAWWFEQTEHIIPNHVIVVPDPNVTIAKKCVVFPIEFVVHGYITGTTATSLWTHYNKGARKYCGLTLPDGLRKNQRLAEPLLIPTIKDKHHDRPISADEIISEGLMTAADWEVASSTALALYQLGSKIAAERGLILVDTKYEMGRDLEGNLTLVDEIHTPDSSRYWLANSYQQRFANNLEPDYIDKEFLRLWFANQCDPYHDIVLPEAPIELIVKLSERYIQLYELITGNPFCFPNKLGPIHERVRRNIAGFLV